MVPSPRPDCPARLSLLSFENQCRKLRCRFSPANQQKPRPRGAVKMNDNQTSKSKAPPGHEHRLPGLLVTRLPLAVIVICAGAATTLALTDYGTVKAWLDGLSADGSMDALSAAKFEAIKRAAYACLAAVGVLSAGIILLRERISALLAKNAEAFRSDFAAELRRLRDALAGTPAVLALTLAVIIIAGVIPRLYYLNVPIRYDEAYTYLNYVSRPVLITLSLYDAPNNHILYSLCAKLCVTLFGPREWALRLPAFIAGVLLIPGVYPLGRAVFGSRGAGLLAAGAVSGSAYMIEYAINARGYSFICLFTVFLLIAAERLARSNRNLCWWSVFVISAAAGMAAMPIMVYPLALACVWLTARRIVGGRSIARNSLKRLLTALALIVILTLLWYAPALITGGSETLLQRGLAKKDFWSWLAEMQALAGRFFINANAYLPGWAVWISALAVSVGALRRPLLSGSALVLVALFYVQNVAPFARVLLFLVLLYLVVAGGGIAAALDFAGRKLASSQRLVPAAAVAVLIACAQAAAWTIKNPPPDMDNAYRFPEARQVVRFLDGKINAKTPVLTGVPSDNPLIYYGLERNLERMSFLSLGMVTEKFDSLWVVVNERDYKCTLPVLIKANGLDTLYRSEPSLVAKFDPVRIYLLSDTNSE